MKTKILPMKILEWITSFFAWLEIVFFPTFIGFAIACVFYYNSPSRIRLVISIVIATVGLIIGIIIATRIWKTQGTTEFISKVSATPELDNLEKNDE
jgi:hypothetical protein